MILDILRFVRGYVAFTVSGKYPERFINITARNGIHIWDVIREGDAIKACMYMSDYRDIRDLARKSGVRLRVSEKRGLPVFISAHRGRVGVAVGICVFILTVFVMSMFIWSIDITGLDTVSVSEMTELLRAQGLYVGAFKPSLDFTEVSRNVMLSERGIGWMAVNVSGSYASVEVKEESPAPEVADINAPCNVKAERDARILSIDAYQGERVITEGSGVVRGQLIVSGVMSDEQGGLRLVRADARVMAQTERRAEFSTAESYSVFKPSGEAAERRYMSILGAELPYMLGSVSSPYSVTDVFSDSPRPLSTALPLKRVTELVYALEERDCRLDCDSAKELLTARSELYEAFALSDCTVTEREFDLSLTDGVYTLGVTYTCVEDIAAAEPIGTDENTDLDPDSEKPS